MASINRNKECVYCETTCVRCKPQYHQNMTVKHYEEEMLQVPRSEIVKVLNMQTDDEPRRYVGGWLANNDK